MKKIKIGLLGYGLSGRYFHSKVINQIQGLEITRIFSSKEQLIKKEHPKVLISSIEEIYADQTIDLVVICTPNTSHFKLAFDALSSGKHVVMEKPFTITTHDALRLIDLAKEKNLMLTVYHNRRFDGDFLTVQNLINTDALGRLVEYESHFDRFRNTFKNQWRESDQPGSGILYDLGPHLIDQALYLFGLPHEVYCDISAQRRGETDDAFELILYYAELKVSLKAGMLVKIPTPRFRISGTQGTFLKYGLDPQEPALIAEESFENWGQDMPSQYGILDTDEKTTIATEAGDYRLYYQNIYDHLVLETDLLITSDDAFNTIRIIEAAIKSNKDKKRIEIKK